MHLVLISIILLCQLHVEISNTALQSHQASIAHCRMLIRRPNFPKLSYFIESQLPSIVCCILISKTLQYQKSMFQYLYNLVVNKGSVFSEHTYGNQHSLHQSKHRNKLSIELNLRLHLSTIKSNSGYSVSAKHIIIITAINLNCIDLQLCV